MTALTLTGAAFILIGDLWHCAKGEEVDRPAWMVSFVGSGIIGCVIVGRVVL